MKNRKRNGDHQYIKRLKKLRCGPTTQSGKIIQAPLDDGDAASDETSPPGKPTPDDPTR